MTRLAPALAIAAETIAVPSAPPDAPPRLVPVQPPLSARLDAAAPAERAALLRAAALAGEPLRLAGADLRGLDLSAAAPRGEPLRLDGADLHGATLTGANLAGVSLRGACLDGAFLVGACLAGCDLAAATLRGAQLTGADIRRADLSFADLRGASLLTADLSYALATGADLRESLLHAARLCVAVLRGADLRWARLDGARLAGADLRMARLDQASLVHADLSRARLSEGTSLAYAFLHHARFDGVELTRAHLGDGPGECCRDFLRARDTLRHLARHFAATGRHADARWAHRQAGVMGTRAHRPDRARAFFPADWEGADRAARSRRAVAAPIRHGLRWTLGWIAQLATGYGTSYRRILAALAIAWLGFAAHYHVAGGLMVVEGTSHWTDALRFSAASLSPLDAFPVVATSHAARWAALAQGVLGMGLLGALGYVTASRMRCS